MTTILTLILSFCCVGLVFCLIMLARNHVVFKVRTELVKRCGEAARAAIERGEPWKCHYKPLNDVSYNEMLYDFGKWTMEDFLKGS